ncbi:MAG: Uncharacterized protein Athens071426_82 [Parcubacteria group bacterium Athens0714_26]|nr:MAG: Uncharacterized protein Athens101426_638 [Parcubacteria group bacterium Athens1014_26]TSD03688.1 MAG: Uncharacterized protein Athens071426_82 [Parcubacteria group bacterium Athens0714_26]
MQDISHKKIIWTTPEYLYRPKTASWYWKTIIATALLIIISFWLKNLLFAIFIFIAEIILITYAKRYPKNIEFEISEEGIRIDKKLLYSFDNLESFHIKNGGGDFGELILKVKSKINPYLKINIFNKDILVIKTFLQKYLEEMEYKESLSDTISDILGF